jgi:hypothetical protein
MVMRQARRLSTLPLILVVILALLGSYVYLVEVRGGARQERAQEAGTHLLPFPPEAISEMVIERPNERIVCRKVQGHWRIEAPVRADADESGLARLLEEIAQAHIERTLPAQPGELAAFGLIRPTRILVAAGDQRRILEVGKANPTGELIYVRQARAEQPTAVSAPILLVEKRIQDIASKTLTDLRDKTLFAFTSDDVTGITFSTHGRRVRLVRQPAPAAGAQPAWELVEPLKARADRGSVERMLGSLSSVRAEEFVAETPSHLERYHLDKPRGSVRFELKEGRTDTLLYGGSKQTGGLSRYYAHRPGTGPLFTINANLPGEAERAATEWRERHLVDFDRTEVAELRLISAQRTVVCVRTDRTNGDEWRLAEFLGPVAEGMNVGAAAKLPTAQRADRDLVQDLLAHLATLQATTFLDRISPDDPHFELARPALKIVALDKTGKILASVALGALHGSGRYATSPHLGALCIVPAADAERFQVRAENLAARS